MSTLAAYLACVLCLTTSTRALDFAALYYRQAVPDDDDLDDDVDDVPPAVSAPGPVPMSTSIPIPSDTSAPAIESSRGLSEGAKAGIAVGVIVPILILSGGLFWLWRRFRFRRCRRHETEYNSKNHYDSQPTTGSGRRLAPDTTSVTPPPPPPPKMNGNPLMYYQTLHACNAELPVRGNTIHEISGTRAPAELRAYDRTLAELSAELSAESAVQCVSCNNTMSDRYSLSPSLGNTVSSPNTSEFGDNHRRSVMSGISPVSENNTV